MYEISGEGRLKASRETELVFCCTDLQLYLLYPIISLF